MEERKVYNLFIQCISGPSQESFRACHKIGHEIYAMSKEYEDGRIPLGKVLSYLHVGSYGDSEMYEGLHPGWVASHVDTLSVVAYDRFPTELFIGIKDAVENCHIYCEIVTPQCAVRYCDVDWAPHNKLAIPNYPDKYGVAIMAGNIEWLLFPFLKLHKDKCADLSDVEIYFFTDISKDPEQIRDLNYKPKRWWPDYNGSDKNLVLPKDQQFLFHKFFENPQQYKEGWAEQLKLRFPQKKILLSDKNF